MMKTIRILTLFLASFFVLNQQALAACGATDRTWDGSSNSSWRKGANWSGNNAPDTAAENAIIVSAARRPSINANITVGCVDIQSGDLRSANNRTLTIVGDYFRAPNLASIAFTAGQNSTINLAGTAHQDFDVVDPINHLIISNSTSVAFNHAFEVRGDFTMTGTGTYLSVNDDLTLSLTGQTVTIPTAATIEVASGKTLNIFGSLVIDGTLILNPGSTLVIGDGNSITVGTNGSLRLEGADGNVATVRGQSAAISATINGILWAQYFRFSNIAGTASGLQINGTISVLDYGEFHFIPNAGAAITLASSASVPTISTGVGFYDDNSYGNTIAVNASAYNGTAITFNNWSGNGNTENDPNSKINWGAQAGTMLTLSNNSNSGSPSNPVTAGGPSEEFAIFAFALSQASSATDITQVTFTLNGSALSSDVEYIQVFNQGANCQTVGAQIGSNLTMSGSPAKATINIPPGTVTTNGTTPACIHVYVKTSATAQDNATIGIMINGTDDVVNSQGYSFSGVSGPPVSGPMVTISGDPTRLWRGTNSTAWRNNRNWQGGWPAFNENCRIQSGIRIPLMANNEACQNTTMINGGTLNWNNTTWSLTVWGFLNIEPGFTFQNAASASLIMGGTTSQSMTIGTTFPGNVIINNTGGTNSVISVDGDSYIQGNLTVTSGILRITPGTTLQVNGNVTIETGGVLDIEGGGILKLGNGSVVTVNPGGTLEMIGSGVDAIMQSTGGSAAFTVVVNGTIKAQGYLFDHLGTNGVTINASAIIDATYNLSGGTYKHPVNNSSTLLTLNRKIPGDALTNMAFDLNGSSASAATITNILTNPGLAAGTLSISSYSGNLAGATYDNDASYLISWTGLTNTIDVIEQTTGPASVYQGQTYIMGRFSMKQSQAGASYVDTNVTSITLTLLGTGSSNDVTSAKLYYDDNCDSADGVLKGSGTFSGNPAKVTFSGMTGTLIEASTGTPPTRCFYVTFDIASNAVNGQTLGFSIAAVSDFVTDQNYKISGSTPPPISSGAPSIIVGSSTIWTGAVSTNWFTAGNWNGGVPTQDLNCVINPTANQPVISSGTAICKTLNLGAGATLNLNAAATLNLYGSLNNDGIMTASGTVNFTDNGSVSTNQIIKNAITIGTLQISKTAGGTLSFNTTLTANALNFSTVGAHLQFGGAGKNLVLPNGATLSNGTLTVSTGGTIRVGNGQTFTVAGGTLRLLGTAEAYPQNLASKAKMTVDGAGTWGLTGTSGNIQLSGFQLDYLNTSGLNLSGTVNLTALTGGQFTNLSTSYASVKVMQVNTTGSLPAIANHVGINWGPTNLYPANTEAYQLASSTGCNNQSMDFDNFFGDWFENTGTFNVNSKVSQTNCNVTFSGAVTAVALKNLTATPYNGAIDLRWETTNESDHLGFHVYRSLENGDHFVQLSTRLIRNFNTSGTYGGKYRFVDFTAENDVAYFYYVQDVDYLGKAKLWGPIAARAANGLGTPPVDQSGDNSGTNPGPDNPTTNPSPIPNGFEDLGNGVTILSRSQNSIRLKIVPGALTNSSASWNSSYKEIAIPGYSKTEIAGSPQTLERTLLLEVDPDFTIAVAHEVSLTSSVGPTLLISPAPQWVLNSTSGILEPQYFVDTNAYNLDSLNPSQFYQLSQDLVTQGDKKFVKIVIRPVLYNAFQQTSLKLDQVILDISLGTGPWYQDIKTASVYARNNTIHIGINSTGMYEVTYDQLVSAFVEGPVANSNIGNLRVYQNEMEIPIEVVSSDSIFNSGDKVRFFGVFTESRDNAEAFVVLTDDDLQSSGTSPLRLSSMNGDYAQAIMTTKNSYKTISAEENNIYITDTPVGEQHDHFFWKMIFAPYPSNVNYEKLPFSLSISGLDVYSNNAATLSVYLKGTTDEKGNLHDLVHTLGLYINNTPHVVAIKQFTGGQYQRVNFQVPVSYLFNGLNAFVLKALAGATPYSDRIQIDRVELRYPYTRSMSSDQDELTNEYPDYSIAFDDLTNSLARVFDITNIDVPIELTNLTFDDHDADGDYRVRFYANPGSDFDRGRRFWIVNNQSYKTPTSLNVNRALNKSLRDSDWNKKFIVIGSPGALEAVEELIDRRISQGLSVVRLTYKDIYNEFSFSRTSARAIKDFLLHAYNSWSTKPSYVLLLGDSTYDPKDLFGYGVTADMTPMPIVTGMVYDFGSDNWFVTKDGEDTPLMSIGRMPTSDPVKLRMMVRKTLDFEDELASPSFDQTRLITYLVDQSDNHERFLERAQELSQMSEVAKAKLNTVIFDRFTLGDSQMASEMENSFSNHSLILNYIGHGAEDAWTDNFIFSTTEAENLGNSEYPIVMALNCLNNYFYDPDVTWHSLGETLLANQSGGAVAFIGSTAMTTPNAQTQFAKRFYQVLSTKITNGDKSTRLGDIFMLAKQQLPKEGYYRDLLNSYLLMGDPTLKFPEKLFFDPPPQSVSNPAPASVPAKKAGLGCSVNASNGPDTHPAEGIVELLGLFGLYLFGRWLFRKIKLT